MEFAHVVIIPGLPINISTESQLKRATHTSLLLLFRFLTPFKESKESTVFKHEAIFLIVEEKRVQLINCVGFVWL